MQGISNIVSGLWPSVLMQTGIVRVVEAVLVIILAFLSGKIITDFLSYSASQSQLVPETVEAGTETMAAQSRSIGITAPPHGVMSLFGVPEQQTASVSQQSTEIQETQLNLILRGIMVNTDSNQRLALIAVPGNVEKVYAIGEEIEGARIVRIEPGRVILNRNGRDEALYISIPKVSVDKNNNRLPNSNLSERNGIRKINDTQRVVSQQTLRQQLNNLPGLLRQAKAVPHAENGESVGFKVVEIQEGSIFEDLGIQKEDIIQSVNGRPVKSAEDALNAYRRLRTSRSFQLGLLRDGRPVSLNLSVQ